MIKIETRGKYPGVKIHLDPEEAQALIAYADPNVVEDGNVAFDIAVAGQAIAQKMGKKIAKLLQENPNLLKERSKEEVAAILAKESEKAALQLAAIQQGQDWKKVNKDALQEALLKHVK